MLATFVVNDSSDEFDRNVGDGVCDTNVLDQEITCSLRAALDEANVTPNMDDIHFNLGGGGLQTIVSRGVTARAPVNIDGRTQPGFTGSPIIELQGIIDPLFPCSGRGSGAGIQLEGGNSSISGFVIHGFEGPNVVVMSDDNRVVGSYIGTDPTGRMAGQSCQDGVFIQFGSRNDIGGFNDGDGNLISGNGRHGINIDIFGNENRILRNFIGTDIDGTRALANAENGVHIFSGQSNQIGLAEQDGGNLISGNGKNGVGIRGQAAAFNTLSNNFIGIGFDELPLANANNGVHIESVFEPLIGGFEQVVLNRVGTPGFYGANTIGGHSSAAGVAITGSGAEQNVVENNIVYDNFDGVFVGDGARSTFVGQAGTYNVIDRNQNAGVHLSNRDATGQTHTTPSSATSVVFNYIRDNGNGVLIDHATNNLLQRNYIGRNFGNGIFATGTDSTGNGLFDNVIYDNDANGILLTNGANDNRVETFQFGNVISRNVKDGIAVVGAQGNLLVATVLDNGELGIDLGDDGVTPNDILDGDIGANRLVNYPIIDAALRVGQTTTVQGVYFGEANKEYTIYIFDDDFCDPTGFGEGAFFSGLTTVTTDATGFVQFSVPNLNIPQGAVVTALAVDNDTNDTSEYAACLSVTIVPGTGSIKGTKFEDLNGNSLRDPEEPGRGEFTIELRDDTGVVVDTATTDSLPLVCEPGENWIASCLAAVDELPLSALLTVEDLSGADSDILLSGVSTIIRDVPQDTLLADLDFGDVGAIDDLLDVVKAEIASMLSSDSGDVVLRIGDRSANLASDGDDYSPGLIVQDATDATSAELTFDLFFELDTPAGTLHNNEALRVTATIDRLYASGLNPLKLTADLTQGLPLFDEVETQQATLTNALFTPNAPGKYSFGSVAPDPYQVCELNESGWTQVFPATGCQAVNVGPGDMLAGIDFGNRFGEVTGSSVVARQVAYLGSSFPGPAAIASDKAALLPGETSSFSNFTSYVHGITGVFVDIAGLADASSIGTDDFTFRTGETDDTSTWVPVSQPADISVLEGQGNGGSDRIVIEWPNGTITNTWLEVAVKGSASTGLANDDVFYFGNRIGDTDGDGLTNGTDFQNIRSNLLNFLNPAVIADLFDVNRDRRVNASDMVVVRDHATTIDDGLPRITPSGASPQKVGNAHALFPPVERRAKREWPGLPTVPASPTSQPSSPESAVLIDLAILSEFRSETILSWADSPITLRAEAELDDLIGNDTL